MGTFALSDGRRHVGSYGRANARGLDQTKADKAARQERLDHVSAICRARIYGVASNEAQSNMLAAGTLVSAKNPSNRSAEETALITTLGLALGWITAMRTQVQAIVDDLAIDPALDASWPAPPQDFVDLAALY